MKSKQIYRPFDTYLADSVTLSQVFSHVFICFIHSHISYFCSSGFLREVPLTPEAKPGVVSRGVVVGVALSWFGGTFLGSRGGASYLHGIQCTIIIPVKVFQALGHHYEGGFGHV